MNDDESVGYELGMPPVCVADNGGPFDGPAFVAGLRFGELKAILEGALGVGGPEMVEQWVEPELIPQLDLLAMQRGYTLTSEPCDEHPAEWTYVTFTRNGEAGQ